MGMNLNHNSSSSSNNSRKSSKITIDAEVVVVAAVEEVVGMVLQKRNVEDVIEDAIAIEVVEEETITKTIMEEVGMAVEIIMQQEQSNRRMAVLIIQTTRLMPVNLEQQMSRKEKLRVDIWLKCIEKSNHNIIDLQVVIKKLLSPGIDLPLLRL